MKIIALLLMFAGGLFGVQPVDSDIQDLRNYVEINDIQPSDITQEQKEEYSARVQDYEPTATISKLSVEDTNTIKVTYDLIDNSGLLLNNSTYSPEVRLYKGETLIDSKEAKVGTGKHVEFTGLDLNTEYTVVVSGPYDLLGYGTPYNEEPYTLAEDKIKTDKEAPIANIHLTTDTNPTETEASKIRVHYDLKDEDGALMYDVDNNIKPKIVIYKNGEEDPIKSAEATVGEDQVQEFVNLEADTEYKVVIKAKYDTNSDGKINNASPYILAEQTFKTGPAKEIPTANIHLTTDANSTEEGYSKVKVHYDLKDAENALMYDIDNNVKPKIVIYKNGEENPIKSAEAIVGENQVQEFTKLEADTEYKVVVKGKYDANYDGKVDNASPYILAEQTFRTTDTKVIPTGIIHAQTDENPTIVGENNIDVHFDLEDEDGALINKDSIRPKLVVYKGSEVEYVGSVEVGENEIEEVGSLENNTTYRVDLTGQYDIDADGVVDNAQPYVLDSKEFTTGTQVDPDNNTKPEISGNTGKVIKQGQALDITDPLVMGVVGKDAEDGDVTEDIKVIDNGGFKGDGTDAVGEYIIKYQVEDSQALSSDIYEYKVIVVNATSENTKPYITGREEKAVPVNSSIDITDPLAVGIQGIDLEDGDITSDIKVIDNGGFNSSVAGTYTIKYQVEDSQGLSSDEYVYEVKVSNEISSCKDLESIGKGANYPGANHPNAWELDDNYILTKDINCSATNPEDEEHDIDLENTYGEDGFDSIGTHSTNSFTGQLDGQGYEVQDLYINKPSTDHIGLVGYNRGIISNIGLDNVSIIGQSNVGGLVGYNNYGEIRNSYAAGNVQGELYVGGLVGHSYNGNITNSYTTGDVNGENYAGGLVGDNAQGDIVNSYTTGNVEGKNSVGGIVGYNNQGDIVNSYTTGNVQGEDNVGGIVGINDEVTSSNRGEITNNYVTGNISGKVNSNYLVGYNQGSNLNNNYVYEGSKLNDKTTNTRLLSDYNIVTREELSDKVWYIEQGYDNLVWDLDTVDDMCYIQLNNVEGQECNSLPTGNHAPYISFSDEYANRRDQAIVELGTEIDNFEALQIQAQDEEDGTITENIQIVDDGGYNKDEAGIYDVTYSIEDSQGVISEAQIEIQVGYKEINTCQDIEAIDDEVEYMNDGYRLNQDIDCSSIDNFTSIKNSNTYFAGIIDGNEHEITNYTSTKGGLVQENYGIIKDLGLTNTNINTASTYGDYTGGIANINSGEIANSYVAGDIQGYDEAGGIAGRNYYGKITNSYAKSNVIGESIAGEVGGIAGSNYYGKITNSYATGDVAGNNDAGGLIGRNFGQIANSYAIGDVTGNHEVGGLVGRNQSAKIINSYATGDVKGNTNFVGGLVGYTNGAQIINSYRYEGQVIECEESSYLAGDVVTLEELQNPTWYTDTLGFDSNWNIDSLVEEGYYPHVMKEDLSAEVLNQANNEIVGEKPVIIGETDITISYIDSLDINDFESLGIKGIDNKDGDITASITLKSNVDGFKGDGTDAIGDYNLVYTVTDSNGNVSDDYNYIVHVINNKPTLSNEDKDYFYYADEGVRLDTSADALNITATDYEDGDVTASIVVDDTIYDESTPDTYEITYTIEDSLGAVSDSTADIRVKDRIDTCEELDAIDGSWYYYLEDDIDCVGVSYTPLETLTKGYEIDGRGHTIYDLDLSSDELNIGLVQDNQGTIKNLGIDGANANITTPADGKKVATIASINNGTISNVWANNTINVMGDEYSAAEVGSIAAVNNGTISDVYALGQIQADASSLDIGGIVNRGSIGGVVGQNNGTLTGAYSAVNVEVLDQYTNVGGVVGQNTSNVSNVLGYGNVSIFDEVTNNAGKVVGAGTVTNGYYYDGSQINTKAENIQGTSLTKEELMLEATYDTIGFGNNWDKGHVTEGYLPTLIGLDNQIQTLIV